MAINLNATDTSWVTERVQEMRLGGASDGVIAEYLNGVHHAAMQTAWCAMGTEVIKLAPGVARQIIHNTMAAIKTASEGDVEKKKTMRIDVYRPSAMFGIPEVEEVEVEVVAQYGNLIIHERLYGDIGQMSVTHVPTSRVVFWTAPFPNMDALEAAVKELQPYFDNVPPYHTPEWDMFSAMTKRMVERCADIFGGKR